MNCASFCGLNEDIFCAYVVFVGSLKTIGISMYFDPFESGNFIVRLECVTLRVSYSERSTSIKTLNGNVL